MRKHLIVLFVGLILQPAFSFAGETKAAAAGKPIVIGLSVPYLGAHFFSTMNREAEQVAAQLGVTLVVADAWGQTSKQAADIANFVTQGVQGILISPQTTELLVPAIEAAVKAGIPVVTVDRTANTDKVLFHVGADNVQAGAAAAQFIIDRLKNKGSAIELEGSPGSSVATDRKAGFDEIMRNSNAKILASRSADWERSVGQGVMKSLMQDYPHFDAVFAANDEMIVGAIDAMSAAHVDLSKMVTVGFDATPVAFQYMRDGKLSATIDQFPDKQAGQALRYLVDYIRNKTKPPKQVFLIEPKLITPELVTMAP